MTTNVDDYIDSLPEDRRIAIRAVREAVNAKLPAGYEEGIVYNMISWFVPFTRLAETYNGQPLCLASRGAQKNYMTLHLMCVYGDPKLRQWFEKAYKASGKKLDMGKGCLRFKNLEALPLPVVSEVISKVSVDTYVAAYEKARANTKTGKKAAAKAKAKAKAKATAKTVQAKAKKAVAKAKTKVRAAVARAKTKPAAKKKSARA
jgi:regulator of protease activity HflC (stomatin/prohibitin superfamily)